MAKFKPNTYPQGIFSPIFLCSQIHRGTFEYTLAKLIDNVLDLSAFEGRYNNDLMGATAYDPRILIKVIFLAYSRGVTSSRKIAEYCRDNIPIAHTIKNAEELIAPFAKRFRNEKIDIEERLLEEPAGTMICEVARIQHCELIIMGSRGLTSLEGFFIGSVTNRVLHTTPCSVLVIK